MHVQVPFADHVCLVTRRLLELLGQEDLLQWHRDGRKGHRSVLVLPTCKMPV